MRTPTTDQPEEDFGDALELRARGSRGGAPAELYGKKLSRFDHRNNPRYRGFLDSGTKWAYELNLGW